MFFPNVVRGPFLSGSGGWFCLDLALGLQLVPVRDSIELGTSKEIKTNSVQRGSMYRLHVNCQ